MRIATEQCIAVAKHLSPHLTASRALPVAPGCRGRAAARAPGWRLNACALATSVIVGAGALGLSAPVQAQAVDCAPFAQAAAAGRDRAQVHISEQEAATKEAMDAAKQCLANIDRALNGLIPGIRFTVDFSGILRNMINRACQVVTTRIDAAGNVIGGTVSDATNRFNGVIPPILPPGTIGVSPGPGGGGGGGFFPSPPAPPSPPIVIGPPGGGGGGGPGMPVDPGVVPLRQGAIPAPSLPQAQAPQATPDPDCSLLQRMTGNCARR